MRAQPDLFRRWKYASVEGHACRVLDVAIRRHRPVYVFAGFSGGHDSLCATHLTASFMAEHYPDTPFAAAHINTGIGIEATREFVRSMCREHGWPLVEYRATDCGQDYKAIVQEHGFPGPAQHARMYARLKERPIRRLTADHKNDRRDRVMLVTGVRRQESTRRMGTVETINREGARVWVAPLIEWDGLDKNCYMERHGLRRNEVVDLLHMSGECLCGAFAEPGELEMIRAFFPETAARIDRLQDEARAAGAHCKWGTAPPEPTDPAQGDAFTPLCHSCDHRGAA